jgi:hypothetical protein
MTHEPGKSGDARIFAVETRFQKLARRPGGISRDKAIERADAQIEQVKPSFDELLDGELKAFASLVKNAEGGEADPDWIAKATFHARELRDSATTLGFELLSFIADSLCDVLDTIAAGTKFNMESITCHVDALMLARQKSYRRLRPDQVPELTKGLRRVVNHVTTAHLGNEETRS